MTERARKFSCPFHWAFMVMMFFVLSGFRSGGISFRWLPIRQRVEFELSLLVFNCMHNLAGWHPAICLPCANRSLITLVVVTYARQHVVILLFQPQGRSFTVLAASPWQDRPPGTLFQRRYAAVILHPRIVVIWKLNCLSERITSTLVTVPSCKSGRT